MDIETRETTTNIIPGAEFSFGRDKFKIRLGGIYFVEDRGWMAAPRFTWSPADGLEIAVEGVLFGGREESTYQYWDDNDSVSLELIYYF